MSLHVVALLLSTVALGEKPSAQGSLWLDGRRISLDALPADLPAAHRSLLEKEREFAQKHRLRVYAKAKCPVVLFSEWDERQTLEFLSDAEKLAADFPRLFPEPTEAPPLPDEETDGGDPNTPFPLYVLSAEPVYKDLAERLASEHEYLKGWAENAIRLQGFQLYRPRIAVILAGTYGDPRHWVVHELTHVLAYPRYGRQPFWMEEGMAWFAEDAILRGVFAFCYRQNFLWDAEQYGWASDFGTLYKSGNPPSVLELAGLRPGSYSAGELGVKDPRALLAYGLVAYATNERRAELAALLHGFAVDFAEKGEFHAGYEVPIETQRKLLSESLGADLDKKLAAFASRLGKDIPKPKAAPPKSARPAN